MAEVEIDKKRLEASIHAAIVTIKLIDPTLVKVAQKQMKAAGEIIAQDARSRIPDVPTGVSRTGRPHWGKWGGTSDRTWNAATARRGIKTRYRAPRKDRPSERPIISVVQENAAGAVYDMAGKNWKYVKNEKIAAGFIGAMNRSPSRTMWPAAEANMSSVLAAMDAARVEMESEINSRLGKFGSGLAGV